MDEFTTGTVLGLAIKLYALMTPTAVLVYFIENTSDMSQRERFIIASKTGIAIFMIGELLFLCGNSLFSVFGFTRDAFSIGVGILLFLSAIRLMNDKKKAPPPAEDADISIVPLAIPLGMGPASIGWVMVMGANNHGFTTTITMTACLLVASACMIFLLCLGRPLGRVLGKTGIAVMAKLNALLLAALAAQVIFTGIRAFIKS